MSLIEQLTRVISHTYARFLKCPCVKQEHSKNRKKKKKKKKERNGLQTTFPIPQEKQIILFGKSSSLPYTCVTGRYYFQTFWLYTKKTEEVTWEKQIFDLENKENKEITEHNRELLEWLEQFNFYLEQTSNLLK